MAEKSERRTSRPETIDKMTANNNDFLCERRIIEKFEIRICTTLYIT